MMRKMDLREAQLALVTLWVGGILPASLLMLDDTLVRQSPDAGANWGRLLSETMPTIGLVLGAFTATPHTKQSGRSVDIPFFRITFSMSAFYLLIVNFGIMFTWYERATSNNALGTLSSVLGPMQGLLTAALGFFFIRLGNPEPLSEDDSGLLVGEVQTAGLSRENLGG